MLLLYLDKNQNYFKLMLTIDALIIGLLPDFALEIIVF